MKNYLLLRVRVVDAQVERRHVIILSARAQHKKVIRQYAAGLRVINCNVLFAPLDARHLALDDVDPATQ